jgi:streptomycin 3"-adenylyltransferase
MWATVETGAFLPKDKAAKWASGRIPAEYGVLLDLAARAYCGECRDDWQTRELEAAKLTEILRRKIDESLMSKRGLGKQSAVPGSYRTT